MTVQLRRAGITFAAFLLYMILFHSYSTQRLRTFLTLNPEPALIFTRHGNASLNLIIPVTTPNALFCKVLSSANINRYSPPLLVNYGIHYDSPAEARAGKIIGLHNTLSHLSGGSGGLSLTLTDGPDEEAEETKRKLALIVDGFDAWFQLGPEVMVERYLAATKARKVLFGADKECWPNAKDSAACTAIPESPLPLDAYGPETDKDEMHYKTRPRFLNSGTILGKIIDVEEIFSVARKDMEAVQVKGHKVQSDQGIVADIFGTRRTQAQIELDYYSEFFQTMTHSHDDIIWSKITGTIYAKNNITNKVPVVLHFNGPKNYLEDWWPKMWFFHSKGALAEMMRRKQGAWAPTNKQHTEWEWISWDRLCGRFEEIFLA